MADQPKPAQEGAAPPQKERIPIGQVIFDDIFLLLTLGLTVPTLFYIVWGLWHTSVIPVWHP
ncbi:MAG: hypothetical protein HY023_01900 [Chloroflexi bacterium]|nr:hypothetical protein [Chloroflexota bacterium]MBI3764361.1 hypothetical protein [Chloroflexota bacterium]